MIPHKASRRLLLLLSAAIAHACGGGSSGSPTTPTASAPPSTSTSACAVIGGAASPALAILYGTVCTAPNSPIVFLNLYDQSGSRFAMCSGTVIARRSVLTAAHCLTAPTSSVSVFLSSGDTVSAASFTITPGYRGTADAASIDLGVVTTSQDLPPTPVPVLSSRDARVGEQAVVAGWGQSETNTQGSLRAGTTTVAAVTSAFIQIAPSGPSASGVCYGDSGGPLLVSEGGTWAVAGVTSAFTGNSCSAGTSAFTNLRNANAAAFVFGLVPDAGRK